MDAMLLQILETEVKPALGCTGPVAIAYTAAEALNAVGGVPRRIVVKADKDMLAKNADVGIPGTDFVGIPIAAALGAMCGDAAAKMEVLHNVTPADAKRAHAFVANGHVEVKPDWETKQIGAFMDIVVETENGVGRAVVVKTHTNLVLKSANGQPIFERKYERCASLNEDTDAIARYTIADMYAFADMTPIANLKFLSDAFAYNFRLAEEALSKRVGCGFAVSMMKRCGDNPVARAKAYTAAAAEARMSGVGLPAMACATSGNVGIAASLPIYCMSIALEITEEKRIRALALSYLLTILGKNRIGRLSAMCSCVACAACGTAAGMAYLLGGDITTVQMAIDNTLINVFGVVCDGARLACALKLSSAAGIGIEAAYLAMDGVHTPANQGVIGKTADDSLRFLGKFAKEMVATDEALCRALYEKQNSKR